MKISSQQLVVFPAWEEAHWKINIRAFQHQPQLCLAPNYLILELATVCFQEFFITKGQEPEEIVF